MDGLLNSFRSGLGMNSANNAQKTPLTNSGSNQSNSSSNVSVNSSVSRRNRNSLPSLKKTVPANSALLSKPLKNSSTMSKGLMGGSRRTRRSSRKFKRVRRKIFGY